MNQDQGDQPARFSVFVARGAELERLEDMVATVPVTVIVGVPGVGKSALAQAFATGWRGRVVRQRITDVPLGALIDDVRRQLAGNAPEPAGSDEARLGDLARRLGGERGLWVLDDFHRLSDADQAFVLDAFGQAAGAARLVTTSRQAPLPRDGLVDHAELRLLPLDEAGARALWAALDALYGPSERFDCAWQRSRGLPLLLRHAHAGGFDQEDPIDGAVRALSADERALAGALALSEVPLPARALVAMRPAERSGPALRRLVRRLIVDVDGADQCTLHDLYAASVRAALADEERRALHREVARALVEADLDPAIRARHVCGHLIAAGCPAEAADWLVHQSRAVMRMGAAGEFVRAVDAIPAPYRSVALRVERARALLRALDMGRALGELRQLLAAAEGPSEDLRISLAQVALFVADARLARDTVAPLLDAPEGNERRRVRAAATYAVAASYLGEGDEARRRLAALQATLSEPEQAALLSACVGFGLCIEERDDEALEAVRGAASLLESTAASYRAALVPAVFAVAWARQGHIDEAEAMLMRCERVLQRRADPLFQLELQFGRALLRYEAGDRIEALKRFEACDHAYARAGYVLGTIYGGLWLARTLLVLGRRAEALDRLARVEELARPRGLEGVLGTIARVRALDPLRQLAAPPPLGSPSRRGLLVRARALQALRAAADGDVAAARDLVAGNAALTAAPGYALDRAMAALVDAVAARLDGDDAALEAALGRALAEADPACGDAFDAELPRMLLDALGRVRLVRDGARRLAPDADCAGARVVIDARQHELRAPGGVVSLRGRPIVRRLLYALCGRAGRALSKEALAVAAWERDYSPLQHDNALKSNVGHLRRLVADAGVVIVADETGYRLELPPGAVFVEAV